jgi:hypothetical protein
MKKRGLSWRVGIILIALLLWILPVMPIWANVQSEVGSIQTAWLVPQAGDGIGRFLFLQQNENSIISWEQFLRWASEPSGIPLIVGTLMSVLLEYWPKFGTWKPKMKRAVFFGLSLAIPLLAAVLGIVTLGWPMTWEATFWPALVAGVMAFGSGTLSHLPKLPDMPSENRRVVVLPMKDE